MLMPPVLTIVTLPAGLADIAEPSGAAVLMSWMPLAEASLASKPPTVLAPLSVVPVEFGAKGAGVDQSEARFLDVGRGILQTYGVCGIRDRSRDVDLPVLTIMMPPPPSH